MPPNRPDQFCTTNKIVSYAEIASKGPKQTPEEAAAPQPPEVVSTTASTSSLIDVDTPSVRTVPSDFGEQEVKTETQATRLEREKAEEIAARARAEADLAKKKAKHKAHKADNWLAKHFDGMSDGAQAAVHVANIFALVGLSGWMGYKAFGLYEHGRFGWKHLGVGLGVLTAVAGVESILGRYLHKPEGKGKGKFHVATKLTNLVIFATCATRIAAAFDLDDFSNNLAADLAPLLSLFGEAVTKQYLSESTTYLDHLVFCIAPLGIVTTVVSVTRVCGPPWLRAFVGRSQESRVAVEAELCTSTSHAGVCEMFDEGGIARVLGKPSILSLVHYMQREDAKANLGSPGYPPQDFHSHLASSLSQEGMSAHPHSGFPY
ncbi:hypothetical protein OQA88_9143 [Cercophora sp. LCS_1]